MKPRTTVAAEPSSPRPRIALITPLRDEETYIGAMITSIVEQDLRPAKWLIVDDGSTDNTASIVRSRSRTAEFIELLQLPQRPDRRPGGEGAIGSALRKFDLSQFDYIARFDADLLFESDYFVRIVAEFERDSHLGIAGGGLYVDRNGHLELEKSPPYHVRGAVKMYRRECFEQLGGLASDIGWDTIDEVSAWRKGWRTRSFVDLRVIHRRPTGQGLSASRVYKERGRAEYLTWSHPAFVLAKVMKLALVNPGNSLCFLAGFVGSYLKRADRLQDVEFRRIRRDQQLRRMFRTVMSGLLARRSMPHTQ